MIYREKYGPFNPMLRADAAMARVGCAMAGGNMSDFMPWPKEEEQEATLEGVMAVLNAARKD